MAILKNLTLSGYKSIEHASLEFGRTNVLIGPNGAGKSNLVSFFRLLGELTALRLQRFVGHSGGADALLFYGARTTRSIEATLEFADGPAEIKYLMRLSYAGANTLLFDEERIESKNADGAQGPIVTVLGSGHEETKLRTAVHNQTVLAGLLPLEADSGMVFHFHDTSDVSPMRQTAYIHDNVRLREDGRNLAAVLYKLQQTRPHAYDRILATIRLAAPWFGNFVLGPLELNENSVLLNWREQGSGATFGPHQLSDGTLRMIALITLLSQPKEDRPPLIVIDEPELGLHPYSVVLIAALVNEAAFHSQLLLATQSAPFLDQFEAGEVVVVDRDRRESTFTRPSPERLKEWLEEYSLGELWMKNVLGGA